MNEGFLGITAVAEVFPDGQKITAAIVEFDRDIDTDQLSPALFSVKGRTVTRIYANAEPVRTTRGINGRYVVIELSLQDEEARVLPLPPFSGGPGPGGPGGPAVSGDVVRPVPRIPPRARRPLRLSVKQLGPVATLDGTRLPAWTEEVVSDKTSQPVVEDFEQHEYKGLRYTLFQPKNGVGKEYPLVMFIADASANGEDVLLPLVQGLGGVIWAAPGEQAKHPCFVLVPQIPYGVALTRDDYSVSAELETIKELLDHVVSRYNIDPDRIYTTGQSQGCMASCELNVRYPDYFAASLLVAGQWDPESMAKHLVRKNLLIALSEGGPREFPGMNAVVAALEGAGAQVARASIDAHRSNEELNEDVRKLVATGANILYAVYNARTVLPDDGKEHLKIIHHLRGWEITYSIDAMRDWLFSHTSS